MAGSIPEALRVYGVRPTTRPGVSKPRPMDHVWPAACFVKQSLIGTQPHLFIVSASAALRLQGQSRIVAVETARLKAYCPAFYEERSLAAALDYGKKKNQIQLIFEKKKSGNFSSVILDPGGFSSAHKAS